MNGTRKNFDRSYPLCRIIVFTLAGLMGCIPSVLAEVRTWTSTSGTTIEAELVRVEADRAVLRSANGNEVAINLSKLSAGDQAFLNTTTTGTTTDTKSVAPLAHDNKTNMPAGTLFAFSEAQPLAGGLPASITLRRPDDAKFMLIQYGPKSGEVLYVVFDPSGPQVAADTAYVWSPSLIGFQTPRRVVGKPRTMKEAKAFIMEVPVSTQFGDLSVRGIIQIISGVQEWWLLMAAGNFDLVRGGKSSSFQVGGYVNDFTVDVEGAVEAKPARLLADIVFHVASHPDKGQTSSELKMGPYNMIPGKNMRNEIRVVIADENGGKAAAHGWKIEQDHLLSAGHDALFMFIPEKLKSGQKYTTSATIDLGPIFGVKTAETTFTMK